MMFGSNTVTAFAPGNGSTDEQFGAEEKYTLDLLGIIINELGIPHKTQAILRRDFSVLDTT